MTFAEHSTTGGKGDKVQEGLLKFDPETKIYSAKASEMLWENELGNWPRFVLVEMSNGTGTFTFALSNIDLTGAEYSSTIGSKRKIVIVNDFGAK